MKTALSFILCFSMNYSFAIEAKDCSDATTTLGIVECHDTRYRQADKKINAIYRAAMKELSNKEKSALKESQRAWLKYRDATVTLIYTLNEDSGRYGSISSAYLKAYVVERRVEELKELLSGPGDVPDWLK